MTRGRSGSRPLGPLSAGRRGGWPARDASAQLPPLSALRGHGYEPATTGGPATTTAPGRQVPAAESAATQRYSRAVCRRQSDGDVTVAESASLLGHLDHVDVPVDAQEEGRG